MTRNRTLLPIHAIGTVGIEPTHLLLALRKEFSDLANVPKQGATSTVFQSRFMFQRFSLTWRKGPRRDTSAYF
ncbi:TPA: hypothetical protein U7H52_001403 [Streptococcus agalactiae]|nr:hypothetical protein [Streptococcus agalactiae]HEN3163872.1 hypothetical protein [Streptococcus agalactiae]HEN3176397.1 hypothetical protein [Streptococcus agalactiae]HEN3180768.1 hypothetical protein [Streptococcus agalactiae]HEN3187143.1 hypothetical protein [Streptococcus agalactiae]